MSQNPVFNKVSLNDEMKKRKLNEKLSLTQRTIYMDLEYINETLGIKTRPKPEHWKEVVRICALEFDNELGKEISKLDIMVKPRIYCEKLTEDEWTFFTQLSGLSKKSILAGQTFENAFGTLNEFIDGKQVLIMSGDLEVIEFNAKICGMSIPKLNFIKLKQILVEIDKSTYSDLCSCDLHKIVGLKSLDVIPKDEQNINFQENVHNALFNARSMAWFIFKMCHAST